MQGEVSIPFLQWLFECIMGKYMQYDNRLFGSRNNINVSSIGVCRDLIMSPRKLHKQLNKQLLSKVSRYFRLKTEAYVLAASYGAGRKDKCTQDMK